MDFVCMIEIDLIIVSWLQLTCFCERGRNRLWTTQVGLFLVWSSIGLVFVRGVEIKLVSYAGGRSHGFSVSIEIDLVLVWVVEIDLNSVWGWILTWFQSRDEIDAVVWVVQIDLISVNGSELTSF